MIDWDIWLIGAVLAKLLLYTGTFTATGSMLFLLISDPRDKAVRKALLWWAGLGALLALAFTGLRLGLQAGQLLDDGISGMIDPDMLTLVSESPLGHASLLRSLGIVILLSGVLWAAIRFICGLLGAALMVLSFAFVGHATTDMNLLGILIVFHLLAVSYWFGALMPLYRLSGDERTRQEAGILAERFGRQATFVIPVLIIAGGIFAVLMLGSVQAVFASSYGLTLVAKLCVVGILLMLGAINKLRFVPALVAGHVTGARHLRTSIRWEAALFIAVFTATAILTSAVNLPAGKSKHTDNPNYLSPSTPLASFASSPPTRGRGRPESVTTIATMISFARGASLIRTSMPSKWDRT